MNMLAAMGVASLVVLIGPGVSAAQTLRVGDQAPLIAGRDQNGQDWKLADAIGKKVVRLPDRNLAGRVSFLIGLDGKIAHVTRNSDAEVHLAEMKTAVAQMAKR
jgi:peroxiredoxin